MESFTLFESRPVIDNYKLTYLTLLVHGIAILLPWNLYVVASDYFTKYKLPGSNIMEVITIVGQVTNIVVNIINILCGSNGNPRRRIPYAITLLQLVMIATLVLACLDISTWSKTFYNLTIASVVVSFIGSGIYNANLFYVASYFPMEYTNAIVFGTNIGGIIVTVISIGSKAVVSNPQVSAIIYFSSAILVLVIALMCYYTWPKLAYFRTRTQMNRSNNIPSTNYLKIFKSTWLLMLSIWLGMFSTLTIFPLMQIEIKRYSSTFIISEYWFTDITYFLTFNIFVTLGNFIADYVKIPSAKYIWIPIVIKSISSIVFFIFCNYRPDKIPVLFNDYTYWIGSAFYPLVSGYLNSLLMIYVPRSVDTGTASMISVLVLLLGVISGLNFKRVIDLIFDVL
jgi:equilibrative nucleoside transporter 1/2/3